MRKNDHSIAPESQQTVGRVSNASECLRWLARIRYVEEVVSVATLFETGNGGEVIARIGVTKKAGRERKNRHETRSGKSRASRDEQGERAGLRTRLRMTSAVSAIGCSCSGAC